MYLLEDKPVSDHAAFARFRSIHFALCAKRILAEMSDLGIQIVHGDTVKMKH